MERRASRTKQGNQGEEKLSLSEQIISLINNNTNKINRPDYGMIIFSIKDGIVYRIDVSESIVVPNNNGRARLPKVIDSIAPRSSI